MACAGRSSKRPLWRPGRLADLDSCQELGWCYGSASLGKALNCLAALATEFVGHAPSRCHLLASLNPKTRSFLRSKLREYPDKATRLSYCPLLADPEALQSLALLVLEKWANSDPGALQLHVCLGLQSRGVGCVRGSLDMCRRKLAMQELRVGSLRKSAAWTHLDFRKQF